MYVTIHQDILIRAIEALREADRHDVADQLLIIQDVHDPGDGARCALCHQYASLDLNHRCWSQHER